jgi:hypothetical protein
VTGGTAGGLHPAERVAALARSPCALPVWDNLTGHKSPEVVCWRCGHDVRSTPRWAAAAGIRAGRCAAAATRPPLELMATSMRTDPLVLINGDDHTLSRETPHRDRWARSNDGTGQVAWAA